LAIIDKNRSDRFDIPHEPGEWVMLRKLSGSEMDEADQENTRKVMERLAPILKDLDSTQAQAQAAAQDPNDIKTRRATYDPGVLIKHALVGWSYAEEPDGSPSDMLDAITRDWLWDTIVLENTRPPEIVPAGELSSN